MATHRYLVLLLALVSRCCVAELFAQSLQITHQVLLQGKAVQLDSWLSVDPSVSVKITTLKWYLSVQGKTAQTYLMDLSEPSSLLQSVQYPKGSRLYFGVDSQTQVLSTRPGALDPIHGMYWTWQSGYIQWKLEGVMKTDTAEIPIQLHLGGFQNNLQTGQILPPVPKRDPTNSLQITWLLDELLRSITPQTARVMSPSRLAQEYAQRIAGGVSYGLIPINTDHKP